MEEPRGCASEMRIRNFRREDLPALVALQQASASHDRLVMLDESTFTDWLRTTAPDTEANTFVVTDDDDEMNTWGQAGTLEGIEGEIIGYTVLHLTQDQQGYHIVCQGSVHPEHRHRHAGRALLICALNRARLISADFEFEAEQAGMHIYFEALLPARDEGSTYLAERCEMQAVDQIAVEGLILYRRLPD
jgi:ribosomal protein S18 acetylase RimI-like enzyme